jgi:hypothetical protein
MSARRISRTKTQGELMDRKTMVAGAGGMGVVTVLGVLFSFMGSAPWATKDQLKALHDKIVAVEQTHSKDLERVESAQRDLATKADVETLKEMMRELKVDVKELKKR